MGGYGNLHRHRDTLPSVYLAARTAKAGACGGWGCRCGWDPGRSLVRRGRARLSWWPPLACAVGQGAAVGSFVGALSLQRRRRFLNKHRLGDQQPTVGRRIGSKVEQPAVGRRRCGIVVVVVHSVVVHLVDMSTVW